MANTVKIKRSAVSGKVPLVGDLQLGELALNTFDGKLYTKKDDGTASVIEIGAGGGGSGTVTSVAASGGTTGLTFTGSPITTSGTLTLGGTLAVANGGTGASTAAGALTSLGAYPAANPNGYTSNVGTVTSVGGTGTVSGLSLSGTVTTTGNLTLGGTLAVTASNFASQTANTVLAAPNGVAGIPTFRAIAAADVPTLNQNTTGSAGSCTGNSLTATTATNWGSYGAVPAAGTTFGTANTIGRSDANGYTYFSYINSSTTNGENGTVAQVIVTNGIDNFYRKATIAHFTSSLSGTAPINVSGSSASCTGNAATVTSITSGQVTTALGYTPYNSTNPSGYISANQTITLSGDVTGSGTTAITTTLANSGVTAGTYNSVTVNAKGLVTAATAKEIPNVQSVTSSATVTPNADTNDLVSINAQAVGLTLAAPSGTSTDGERLIIRIKDNGTTQTIAWNAVYAAGGATLPTATTAGKWHHVGLIYNSNTVTWLCVAATVQA